MSNCSRKPKRIIAAALTTLFLSHQTMLLSVVATEISGVNGSNGVYNITPGALINGSDIGYRKYKDFNLDKGDVANLIYKYGATDISTFVNLVDNKININGLVNTVRDGNFYNGKAIFVSPNGMVVGASGVLNVGSLGVYTPSSQIYDNYKKNPTANMTALTESNNGKPITINGKVIAANDVTLSGGKVTVGKGGGIIAGVNESKMTTFGKGENAQANALFNQLVNTDNLNAANGFASSNGNIYITTNQTSENAGVNISGEVKNFGTGNIEVRNIGTDGINIAGNISNANGLVKLNNNNGDLNISGNVRNNGTTQIFNVPAEGQEVTFDDNGIKYTYKVDTKSGLNITGNIDTKGKTTITNTGDNGLNISGTVNNQGDLSIQNGIAGKTDSANARNDRMAALNISGKVSNDGTANITNYAAGGLNVAADGSVDSLGNLAMLNTGKGGLTVNGIVNSEKSTVTNEAGALTVNGTYNYEDAKFTNNGEGGLIVNGTVSSTNAKTNSPQLVMTNNKGNFDINENGKVLNDGGDVTLTNNGTEFNINGTVKQNGTMQDDDEFAHPVAGTTNIINNNGNLNINGTVNAKDVDATTNILNKGDALNISQTGSVNTSGKLNITNEGNGGLNIDGSVTNDNTKYVANQMVDPDTVVPFYLINGETTITNKAGTLKVNGTVDTKNSELTMTNNGTNFDINGKISGTENNVNLINTNGGINLNSTGRVNSTDNINITNTGKGGVNVQGLVNAGKNVKIDNKNSNVTIGDKTENNNYITAGNNIDITVNNGSILNYGVEKVLLKADNDLNMNVTDGTIGLGVQQNACNGSGCTGIGPKADGSRDFTKSINANIKGKVNATTTASTKDAIKPEDLVINYAAIDSDMNIDNIKADGRVILTVDDDYGDTNTGKRYNMINTSSDPTKANVEGWGISLISNGDIGAKDNKLTFNQTKAADGYSMDVLANQNIYMKGLDDKYTENKVCNMIAREGDIDVEFSGNTYINNITAEGDITAITRGKNLTINNLGHIEDPSVTPADYFGERPDGWAADKGYDKEDYMHEVLPNNVTLKALDINKNIRPDGVDVDGYYAYADSTVRVNNAVLDNGKLDITADQIYANGIHVDFGQNGFTKEKDDSTNKVIGSDGIPTGHAVRPDDVTDIGRDEHERNYYYHEGDGDGTFNGEKS
ncbi:MAG: hypothetical protein DK841_07465, partial [Candidatus Melainabacteria bacterium]